MRFALDSQSYDCVRRVRAKQLDESIADTLVSRGAANGAGYAVVRVSVPRRHVLASCFIRQQSSPARSLLHESSRVTVRDRVPTKPKAASGQQEQKCRAMAD